MPDLVCSPNAAIAFDYLRSKGLRDFQAAAVIGNLQQESRLNPTAIGDNGHSHGIAQWNDTTPRWVNLQTFAAQSGRSPWDLNVQLEFLWHELETIPAFGLRSILASTDIETATVIFQDRFEACGDCNTPSRISFARSALFACPALEPPRATARKAPVLAVAASVLALAVAAGYGAYASVKARFLQTG